MVITEYPFTKLGEMARVTARENGGRMVRWSVEIPRVEDSRDGDPKLIVYYKPRHWRHCPACQGSDLNPKGAHMGPKGEPVKDLETATVPL